MKTNSTFWSRMESEAEEYRAKAKKNLRSYERQLFKATYHKKNTSFINKNPISPISHHAPQSFRQLQNLCKLEDQQEKEIANKKNYLKVNRDRIMSQSQNIESKYSKILSVRKSSKMEKFILSNKHSVWNEQQKQKNRQIVKSFRYERKKVINSRISMQNQKVKSASQIRVQSKLNNGIINQKRQEMQKKNKVKAEKIQIQKQNNHTKVDQSKRMFAQNVKINRNKKVQSQYQNFLYKKKKNQKSILKLIEEGSKINEQKKKAEQKLQRFRISLELCRRHTRSSFRKNDEKCHKKDDENIFHLTN